MLSGVQNASDHWIERSSTAKNRKANALRHESIRVMETPVPGIPARDVGPMIRRQVSWLADIGLPSAFPRRFHKALQWHDTMLSGVTRVVDIRLQLRGQPRSWSRLGRPHRVPY